MGRRPLLGAYVEPVVAVWMMRRIRSDGPRGGLRERDIADAASHFRSTGRQEIAGAIEGTFARVREAERQWEQRQREDTVAVDGNAETPPELIRALSDREEAPASDSVVMDTAAAAGLLGLSERRVRQLAVGGLLVGRKVGRQWLIDEGSITAYTVNRRLAG